MTPSAYRSTPLQRAGIVGTVILIVAGLAFMGLELRREFERGRELRAAVERSHAARSELLAIFSLMQDAETGQRGYIITGEPRFLSPYTNAERRLSVELPRLRAAYADNPAQSASMRELETLIDRKQQAMQAALSARDVSGREAGIAAVSSGRGKAAMDQIRIVVNRMVAADAQALAAATRMSDARTARTERLVGLVFLLLIAVVAATTILSWRYLRTRRILLDEVQATAARQEAIFDSAIDAIMTLNPSGTIETMNAAAVRMFGWSAEALGRRDIAILMDLPQNGEAGFVSRLGANADGSLREGLVRELTAIRKDGAKFPVDVAFSPLPLPTGIHVVAVVRDITERRRVEEMKQQFVATVSHELRTPLTSIAGSLGLLAGGAAGQVSDQAMRLISIAQSNSQRLVRLINDILDIEKLESGQMTLDINPVDLRDIATRSLDSVRGFADSVGVSLDLVEGPPGPVMGDADRLVQVVVNLLSNATKFSPAGGVVSVTVMPEARIARLSVRDSGPGVPESFRARIFSKFAQADGSDTRQRGGTGLGLAIAREIAERHGGRLWFESAPGEGASFHLDLPLATARTIDVKIDGPRLLIVEDDPDAAEVLRIMLDQDGFDARVVGSAGEALDAVDNEKFAAVLVDLQLPDADGIGLIRTLRARADTLDIPVVVVSADVARGKARGRSLEVLDWLEKPFDQDRLRGAITAILRRLNVGRPVILHVDDDPDILTVTAATLAGMADVRTADSLSSARAALASWRPDLIILDLGLPDGSGLELLPDLGEPGAPTIPVVVYSAQEMDAVLGSSVEAVLVKSSASLTDLVRTVRRLTLRNATP
ncbi:CHASE3 domain-containing protein [Brevundimonas sp.]|jgi:PAS domain S-box-containing protein|uniref:CHASE3 domain-containing protein n=1 Tax=Brevundimonas sp. TaxID=1871086 RepID=UPI0037BE8348